MTPIAIVAVALAAAAPTGIVTLHVGVHRDAGTVHDVAVDGAAGQCSIYRERLVCPAEGPVRFRFGPPGDFTLYGDEVLQPGDSGVAWVLADESARRTERARLAPDVVTGDDVRDLFVRTGDHPVQAPSMGMLTDLFALVEHPDLEVRQAVIDALVPWWRHTASDPMPLDAPQLVPGGLIEALGRDRDHRIRRRLANRLREVNAPGEPLQREALDTLHRLARQTGGVQRAATASLKIQTLAGRADAERTWLLAMERVRTPGPPGRAAANTLGRLASELSPSPTVEPERALELVFTHHRERTWHVWDAWRDHVDVDRARLLRLLRETVGYDAALMAWLAEEHPELLAGVLAEWEPTRPHTERWRLVTSPFRRTEHPALRAVLDR
jgi:hypothetical protein